MSDPFLVQLALAEPGAAELRRVGRWLSKVRARARGLRRRPWTALLVSPLGWSAHPWLLAQLERLELPVAARVPIADWPGVENAVRAKSLARERVRRAALHAAAWRTLFPHATAEAWLLVRKHHRRLVRAKPRLRAALASRELRLGPGPLDTAVLHPFHVADLADADLEARQLEAALLTLAACE